MSFSPDQGERVFIADNERLDKPDFVAATASANQGLMARALGLLVGSLGTSQFGGCVTEPTTSWDGGTSFLTINGAVFHQGGTVTSPSGARAGRVIAYDPTKPWQTALTGVDLTAFAPATPCIVWAKRFDSANGGTLSNLDTRKRWLPSASAESAFSTTTRAQDVIEAFTAVSATFTAGVWTSGGAAPSVDYFPVLKIATWTAGVPNVTAISVWDGAQNRALIGLVQSNVQSLGAPSLGSILYNLRAAAARLYDSTGLTNWLTATTGGYSGLKQIDAEMTAVEGRATELEAKTVSFVVSSFTIDKSGGTWLFLLPSSSASVGISGYLYVGTGEFSFTVTAARMVSGGGYIAELTGATVTLVNNGTGAGPTVSPTPTVEITDSFVGTFRVRFWSGGVLTDPDVDGFSVVLTGY